MYGNSSLRVIFFGSSHSSHILIEAYSFLENKYIYKQLSLLLITTFINNHAFQIPLVNTPSLILTPKRNASTEAERRKYV